MFSYRYDKFLFFVFWGTIVVFLLLVVGLCFFVTDERQECKNSGGIVYNTRDGKSFVCVNPKDFLPERE